MSFCRPIDTKGRLIILIGMMGCGKTTVGKELSRLTGIPMLDMDTIIEEQIGKSIPEIFQESGEAHFRALETALLRYVESSPPFSTSSFIISTGGGVVLSPVNRSILRRLGFVVWLDASAEVIVERTSRSNNRPLLRTEDRLQVIQNLADKRRNLYQETAHLRIETSGLDVLPVVNVLYAAASEFFANPESASIS